MEKISFDIISGYLKSGYILTIYKTDDNDFVGELNSLMLGKVEVDFIKFLPQITNLMVDDRLALTIEYDPTIGYITDLKLKEFIDGEIKYKSWGEYSTKSEDVISGILGINEKIILHHDLSKRTLSLKHSK